jgi:signal transduction histidine kinase
MAEGKEKVKTDPKKLLAQREKFKADYLADNVFVNASLNFLIFNEDLNFVFGNKKMIEELGYSKPEDIIGLRPGEILRCTILEEYNCGGHEFCKYCNTPQLIRKSKETKKCEKADVRLLVRNRDGQKQAQDLEISASMFLFGDEKFFLLTIEDVSAAKRKEQLERVFFHDILNKAGGVDGLLEIADMMDDEERMETLDLTRRGMKELLDDIKFQQEFIRAEKGVLAVNKKELQSAEILENIKADFIHHSIAKNNNIKILPDSIDVRFMADPVVLNRVLTNLVKNALEATPNSDMVTLGSYIEDGNIAIKVNNTAIISPEIQSQIFSPSFSTKGTGRGLGTYSVKIFTERYLGGAVNLISTEKQGTTFTISFPLGI